MNISEFLLAVPIWWINGVLAITYWILAHLSEISALLAGALILFGIDPMIQKRASQRPRRLGRGETQTAPPNAQYLSLVAILTWLAVSLNSRHPVPMIGACLWWVSLLAILAVPEERFNQLWWTKSGMLIYAGLVLLLRYGLGTLNQVSPADWAAVVGSRLDAQAALTSTRGSLATLGMLFVFVLYPLGFAGMLLNRCLRNPKPLYNLGLEAGEVLRRLRVRQ